MNYKAIAVAILCAVYLYNLFLSVLRWRSARNPIPANVADVYDALVSKRVYKEEFSFEKAHAIIMEGMGTQFDKGLEACYLRAKPRLEQYYLELG